jgi:hypothetical protein
VASKIEICNLALAKIGSDSFITTIDDGTKSARHLKIFYEPARDALLRSHLWRFARKRAVLAPDATQPPFDGGYYFTPPVDCLRIIGTDLDYTGAYGRWHIDGSKIIADTETLNLVYIYRVEDEAIFDPLFVEAFATKLAHELAMPLTQSAVTKQVMKEEMRETILRAAHAGATEQDSSAFLSEVLIQAHS